MPLELNPEVKARIQQLVARYPRRQAALLPVLHLVQDELGHLSIDAQAAVALALDVPATLVHEVTTFYEMYHEHPEGQYHLEICTNISCHLAGSDVLLDHVKGKLGIDVGHQTEDGVFSLMEAECLASCGSGPMMRVGLDYYEYLTPPAVDALIQQFRSEAPALNGKHYGCARSGPHVGPLAGFEPPKPPPASPAPPVAGPAPQAQVSELPQTAPPQPAQPPPPPPVSQIPEPAQASEPPHPAPVPQGSQGSLPAFEPPPLKRRPGASEAVPPASDKPQTEGEDA